MLTILRQNRDKLRSAVESAVLSQCKEILGDVIKYQIEGLIGITEVDADEVILIKVLHGLSNPDPSSEKSDSSLSGETPTEPDLKEVLTDSKESGSNMDGPINGLMNGTDHDSHQKFSETLFGEGSYEFNMRQDLGGETLSLSVESFQDSFTDINMSTSESSESLSDTTKHTEDECEFKASCDNENDMKNGCVRTLQTPEPREHVDMDEVTVKIETNTEMDSAPQMKLTEASQKNGNKPKYRSRVKLFPERYNEQRQRDAERMRIRRRLRQSQMTEEERQRQRERWRDKKRKQRLKRKLTREIKSDSCCDKTKDGIKSSTNGKSVIELKPLGLAVPVLPGDAGPKNSASSPCKGPAAAPVNSPNIPLAMKEKPQLGQCTSSTPSAAASRNLVLHGPSPKPQDSLGNSIPWHMSASNGTHDPKLISHNTGPADSWRRDTASCLPVSQLSNMNNLGSPIRPPFSSGQLQPQPLFDLTRDDCHIRPQFNMHSTLQHVQGPHRPMSHGPPMSYAATAGPSYPAFSIPYMNTQSSFDSTGFKPPYIKAEPGLGEQPCCSLSGPNPPMNPYVSYKHFNNNPGIHSWDQSNNMPNLDMSLVKQEPVSAYNNWL